MLTCEERLIISLRNRGTTLLVSIDKIARKEIKVRNLDGTHKFQIMNENIATISDSKVPCSKFNEGKIGAIYKQEEFKS